MYGGEAEKLSREMRITVEQARAGLNRFFTKYPGIKKVQSRIRDMLTCMYQPDIGGKVEWREPQQYVESLFGFRRNFELEFSIVRAIYSMASKPSDELSELGKSSGMVVRRERSQTALGATISSLYAVAFGICAGIIRAGINHEIQSPGGDITKELQGEIWTVQPSGISDWLVMPLNIHDELECPTHPDSILQVTHIVNEYIKRRKQIIPLMGMEWKTHMKSWSEK
jgi:DNA polymerase I-like protein with 3'-5' exonuclease and polymerase domains